MATATGGTTITSTTVVVVVVDAIIVVVVEIVTGGELEFVQRMEEVLVMLVLQIGYLDKKKTKERKR